MSRTFSTDFNYKGSHYTALISYTSGRVNIYLPAPELHDIIPGGKASYDPQLGFQIDTPRFSQAQDLLLSIISTVNINSRSVVK